MNAYITVLLGSRKGILGRCGQLQVGPTLRRVWLCALSLSLLWVTTLKAAIGIVGLFFTSPQFSSVYSTCTFAYDEISDQRIKYADCVEREVAVCDAELHLAFQKEKARSEAAMRRNDQVLEAISAANGNCSVALTGSSTSLSEWVAVGGNQITYMTERCSVEEIGQVQSKFNDASDIKTSGVADLVAYIHASEDSFRGVAAYSKSLNKYNIQYIANRTKSLSISTGHVSIDGDSIALGVATHLDASLAAMLASVDQLVDCMGLSNSSQLSSRRRCTAGKGVYDLYEELVSMMRIQKRIIKKNIQSFQDVLDDYVEDVEYALDIADDFYDSINGARGLVRYLVKDLSLFGSSADLCGHTTPNWCSFSKVLNYYISFPFSVIYCIINS